MSLTVCGYCFEDLADTQDHLVPRSAGGSSKRSNLYPACRRCNSRLGDKIFDSIEEKRNYIQGRFFSVKAIEYSIAHVLVPTEAIKPKATEIKASFCSVCGLAENRHYRFPIRRLLRTGITKQTPTFGDWFLATRSELTEFVGLFSSSGSHIGDYPNSPVSRWTPTDEYFIRHHGIIRAGHRSFTAQPPFEILRALNRCEA